MAGLRETSGSVSGGRVKRLVGLSVVAGSGSASDGRVKRLGGLSVMAGLRD